MDETDNFFNFQTKNLQYPRKGTKWAKLLLIIIICLISNNQQSLITVNA